MPETIAKLQPDRTIQLRGFEFGSSAALHSASPTGFTVSGIFRDMAHFAVLLLHQSDCQYEHPRMRHLPDTDFSGIVLQFDVAYTGLQPLDSPKFATIDWPFLDVKRPDGTTAQILLFDYASYVSGNFNPGTNIATVSDNEVQEFDRVTLWLGNLAFDYIMPKIRVNYQFFASGIGTVHSITIAGMAHSYTEVGGESSADIAAALVADINNTDITATARQGDGGTVWGPTHQVNLRSKKDTGASFGVTSSVDGTTYTLYQVQATTVARSIRDQINGANWPALAPTLGIRAELAREHHTQTQAQLRFYAARYGKVNTSGAVVTWVSEMKFTGLRNGEKFILAGIERVIASVESATQLTLTEDVGTANNLNYLANRGGYDGNMITLVLQSKNGRLTWDKTFAHLDAGSSDATWQISLDFTALGIDQVREMWLTFAPKLPNSAGYVDQEWQAVFTNWTVTGGNAALKVAGPGSVRIEENDYYCTYSGASWIRLPDVTPNPYGFFSKGFCQRASTSGDAVSVRYFCQYEHDLYLGTQVYVDRGVCQVSLDGDASTLLDTYENEATPLPARRRLRQAVPAGEHTVVLTLDSGQYFYFDFLEAAVLSDVPDAPGSYALAPATDYDTDVTYKVSPQRLLWWFDRMGWRGRLNHYVGVFWWDQRRQIGQVVPSIELEFDGEFDDGTGLGDGDQIVLNIGGQPVGKTVFPADNPTSIAYHFAVFINATFVGVYATVSGNLLQITSHSSASAYSFSFAYSIEGPAGAPSAGTGVIRPTGSLQGGQPGTWQIDPSQTPALNKGALDWHTNFYAEVAARGWRVVTAFSMEFVNPPDNPASGEVWAARHADGTVVETATGFGSLKSTHCAFNAAVLAQHTAAYVKIAQLMAGAGLDPELQFGEFTWWYFADGSPASMAYYDAETQADALADLGRDLWVFTDPHEEPTNHQEDADWLQDRLLAYADALQLAIRSYQPLALFEVLMPLDVNGAAPSPISVVGGRLNNHVNIPATWLNLAGSLLDIMKVEALAFGTTDRNLDLARTAMRYFQAGWPLSNLYYLAPVQNGGCPFEAELRLAQDEQMGGINTWALDHYLYFGWDPGLAGPLSGGETV